MCELFSAEEVGEMQRRTVQRDVGADRQGRPQQPAAEMPEIVRPDVLDAGALDELPEEPIDAVAPAREVVAQT